MHDYEHLYILYMFFLVKCTVNLCRLAFCEAMETPYLPRWLDAFDNCQADHDPSHQQGQSHLPVQAACVVDGAGNVKSLAVPEVSGGWALLALWHHNCNSNP